jgi:predicted GIY-YIG superfamily endonuclease
MEEKYLCYIITSNDSSKTYVGITNNLERRLRQHNGEIVGGAKYTKLGRPWRISALVTGFKDHQQVLQFEWALKYMTKNTKRYKITENKYRKYLTPTQVRGKALVKLVTKDKWTSNSLPSNQINLNIKWLNQYMIPDRYVLPPYVTEQREF